MIDGELVPSFTLFSFDLRIRFSQSQPPDVTGFAGIVSNKEFQAKKKQLLDKI